jgi:MFS family permease
VASRTSSTVALQNRDFALFQAARVLAIIGSNMVTVAVGWRVHALTGRPLDLGLIGLAQFLPFLAFAAVGGQTVDRLDRRRVLLISYSSITLCSIALALLTMRGVQKVWPIYVVVICLGVTRAFSTPAGNALIAHLVPRTALQNAVTWSSTLFQIGSVLGPLVGGGVDRLTHSTAWVFAGAAGAEALSVLLIYQLEVRPGRMESGALSWSSLLAGFRYVWQQRLLFACISLDLFAVLFGGAVALLPIYAKDILGMGPDGLGLLRSAPAAGAALMAIVLARWPLRRHAGSRLLWAVALFGAVTIVFGISRNLVVSLLALAILGAADMVSVVVRMTVEQLATPHDKRGRVNAVNQIFIGASNDLGAFESGVTAQWMGVVPSVVVGGIASCVVVALWAAFFPVLRKIDRLEDVQPLEPPPTSHLATTD